MSNEEEAIESNEVVLLSEDESNRLLREAIAEQDNGRRRSGPVQFLDDDELALEERCVQLTRQLIESQCRRLKDVIDDLVFNPNDNMLKTLRARLQAQIRARCQEIGDDVEEVFYRYL